MNFNRRPAKTDTLHRYVDQLRQFGQMCKLDVNLEHQRVRPSYIHQCP